MRFLIDEDLPRSIGALIRNHGHEVYDVRDIGLRGARDFQIAAYAQQEQLCFITGDFDFADIRNYPPARYSGMVILGFPGNAPARFIAGLLDGFLRDETLVSNIAGKLAIVEPGRIRIRKE